MGATRRRRTTCVVAIGALASLVLTTGPSSMAVARSGTGEERVDVDTGGAPGLVVPPAARRTLMRRPGVVVRRDGAVVVERVRVPARLAAPGVPSRVLRVRLAGSYPPRALRYEITADGRPIATAVPSRNLRSLLALTGDVTVLSATIGATYGGAPVRPAAAGRSRSLPEPRPLRRLPSPGPFDVARRGYDFGDRAIRLPGLGGKVELRADVLFPAGLPGGPFPLVTFLHGNHSSCYRRNRADYRWPCRRGWQPIPNNEGYDYLASRLASYGYVVVSVSGNGVNVLGNDVPDTGMRQRGELLEAHLDLWQDWSTVGGEPFGDRFIGKVDMSRIGSMGHSRGGEGVVWQVIVDRERDTSYGIDAVLPLAPVDFTRETINEVPLAVMLPYCDGDVFDLQGVHFFDDARYRVAGDPTPKHTITAFGANHNFFNTVWTPSSGYPGSFDDAFGRCEGRLTPAQQRRVAAAYIVTYFRRYLGGETRLDAIWTGESPPRGIRRARALVAYLAPDLPSRRLDVDRFTGARSIRLTEMGTPVEPARLSFLGWCQNTEATPCVPGELSLFDSHLPGLSRGVFGWSRRGARVRFQLGGGVDVRAFDALQMRTTLNPGYRANNGVTRQDLTLEVVDGGGSSAALAASDVGDEALRYPSGLRRFAGHVLLQQLRFPLNRFTGVDLSNVVRVVIRFDRTAAGAIDVADLAFSAGE
jgi:hypothetical protein